MTPMPPEAISSMSSKSPKTRLGPAWGTPEHSISIRQVAQTSRGDSSGRIAPHREHRARTVVSLIADIANAALPSMGRQLPSASIHCGRMAVGGGLGLAQARLHQFHAQ